MLDNIDESDILAQWHWDNNGDNAGMNKEDFFNASKGAVKDVKGSGDVIFNFPENDFNRFKDYCDGKGIKIGGV